MQTVADLATRRRCRLRLPLWGLGAPGLELSSCEAAEYRCFDECGGDGTSQVGAPATAALLASSTLFLLALSQATAPRLGGLAARICCGVCCGVCLLCFPCCLGPLRIQQSAALALGRMANYSEQLAESVGRVGSLPSLEKGEAVTASVTADCCRWSLMRSCRSWSIPWRSRTVAWSGFEPQLPIEMQWGLELEKFRCFAPA